MIDTTNMGIMASLIQPTSVTMATNMISRKDSDSDSSLSSSELGVSTELFSSYDLDNDELLSKSELTTAIDTALSQFNGEMPSKESFQSILADFGFEPPENSGNSLSSSQKDTISSVLENYDANNLSQSDAQEIVAAFKEAGIRPGEELATAMQEAGFDAKEVGDLAGVAQAQGGTPPPPSSGGGGGESSESSSDDPMDLNDDGVVTTEEIEEYYGTNDNKTNLSSNQKNGLDNLQVLMDTLKANSEVDSVVDSGSFDGLLKAINNQNNNSQINTFLQNPNATSTMFDYA